MVPGPHAGGQTVLDAIRPPDGLVLRTEPLHGDYRPEDLLLDHLVVLAQAGDHRRRVEETPVADPLAPRLDLCVAWRAVDEAGHPRELRRVVQRAVVGIGLVRTRGLHLSGQARHRVRQFGSDARPSQHPASGRAVLAGVVVPRVDDRLRCTPDGIMSAAISANSSVDTGVVSDGLSTTVLPAASAGANFQTAIIIG